jgi:selenocysteine lyase/cysteine desulfurase
MMSDPAAGSLIERSPFLSVAFAELRRYIFDMKKESKFLSTETLARARSFYPHTATGRIYFNHASAGPLSVHVLKAMNEHLAGRSAGGIDTYRTDIKIVSRCRSAVQRLINAESPERIAFTLDTSDAVNIVASGLPLKTGDRILLNDAEFPANVRPYYHLKRIGAEIDILPALDERITPEMIEKALTPRTRVVALSAVQFLSGFRADLASIGDLCRRKKIWFVVDGIQALGAVKIDVREMKIDALASGSQKWQMAPHGTGFLYVTQEMQDALVPAHVGWLSVEDPWNFFKLDQPLAATARRYEGGTLNLPGIIGMNAALETLLEFGIDAIESHILALTDFLIDRLQTMEEYELLTPLSPEERSGIVTIRSKHGRKLEPVFQYLADRRIDISIREGKLRFSPHYYNTAEEISASLDILTEATRGGGK